MAVRKVVTRSGRNVRGFFPSVKNHRMMAWESLLERDAMILFEFSSAVVSYKEQPSLERYYKGTQSYKYYPDFLLCLHNEMQINIEVKPSSKMERQSVSERYQSITHYFERNDRAFMVLTEKEIRQEPRLSNLKMLAAHQRKVPHFLALDEFTTALKNGEPTSIHDAAKKLGDLATVYRLIAAGALTCNLNEEIDLATLVTLPQEDLHASLHF